MPWRGRPSAWRGDDLFLEIAEIPAGGIARCILLGDRDQGRVHRSLHRSGLDAGGDQPFDHAGHLLGLCRHVVAQVEIERAGLDEFARAPPLAAAVPISMPSQKPTMPHRSGFCFNTVCVIALALAASQSAAWLETTLISGFLASTFSTPFSV